MCVVEFEPDFERAGSLADKATRSEEPELSQPRVSAAWKSRFWKDHPPRILRNEVGKASISVRRLRENVRFDKRDALTTVSSIGELRSKERLEEHLELLCCYYNFA